MISSLEEALQELGLPQADQAPPTPDLVRRAFRRQALLWHPDKQNRRADGSRAPEAEHDAAALGAAEERFKRLGSAYHLVLLHVTNSSSGPGASPGSARQHAQAQQQQQDHHPHHPQQQEQQDQQGPRDGSADEQLADALSAELLLQASRLRLPDFDMIFLHQRASGGAGGLPAMWPEATRSVDDIWRQIRRRVERRRRTGAVQQAAWGSAPASKWALLREFVVDMLGPGEAEDSPERQGQAVAAADGCETVAVGGVQLHGREVGAAEGAVAAAAAAGEVEAVPPRRRGRLPSGFYWRWLGRLLAAHLAFTVLCKA